MKPPLRLTIQLALTLGLLLGGWYIWGGLALALRLFPEADPPRIWVPRYFPEPETGWVQVAVYAGLVLVLLRSVLGRRRGSGFLAGAGFFVVGIFGTFGDWNFLRDSLAGAHLFVGMVTWRWAKELGRGEWLSGVGQA
jgi:hypothetical protein